MLVSITVIIVVICMAVNSLAYNTSSSDNLGAIYNGNATPKAAWGRLIPAGGIAKLEIRNPSNNVVLAYDTYPLSPYNYNNTSCSCPAGHTRTFYVVSVNGSQVWGDSVIGLG